MFIYYLYRWIGGIRGIPIHKRFLLYYRYINTDVPNVSKMSPPFQRLRDKCPLIFRGYGTNVPSFLNLWQNTGYSLIRIQNHGVTWLLIVIFSRDLFHQPSNKHKTDITLDTHLRDESVRQLVDFCYSSNITVDSQSADKILTAANILQIKEIEKLCITFLAAQQALKSEVTLSVC